jgi:thiol-disulfide isomerase/thioredoxin
MKHKKRFPAKLWPFGKEQDQPPYTSYFPGSMPPSEWGRFWDDYKLAILIFIIGLVVMIGSAVYGQPVKSQPVPLHTQVPEYRIDDILNSPETSVSISDYKDKLLILDFWFTRCGNCIEDMPAVAALQKRFGDKIKIIQIDFEKPDEVLKFYRYHPKLKDLGLPVACNDTRLEQMFPHIYAPHVIWISKGEFIAATEDDYLNAKNIDSILNSKKVELATKTDRDRWDFAQPLFHIENSASSISSTRLYGAVFSGYIPGLGSGARLKIDSATGGQRFDILNFPILNLFGQILDSGLPLTKNRRRLEVSDRSRYINDGRQYKDVWDSTNSYCFEATVPKGVSRHQIAAQLNAFVESELGVSGQIEKINTDVLAIQFLHELPPASKYKSASHELHPGLPMYFHFATVKDIVDLMNVTETMLPVIDETGTYGQVHFDINYPIRPENEATWRNALKANGIELIRCKRPLDIFVLKENAKSPAVLSPKSIHPITN